MARKAWRRRGGAVAESWMIPENGSAARIGMKVEHFPSEGVPEVAVHLDGVVGVFGIAEQDRTPWRAPDRQERPSSIRASRCAARWFLCLSSGAKATACQQRGDERTARSLSHSINIRRSLIGPTVIPRRWYRTRPFRGKGSLPRRDRAGGADRALWHVLHHDRGKTDRGLVGFLAINGVEEAREESILNSDAPS